MKTIYKYKIHLTQTILNLPETAMVLDVAYQEQDLYLWAMIDTNDFLEQSNQISIVGTGHEVPEDLKFLKTLHAPPFVWHVFVDQGLLGEGG